MDKYSENSIGARLKVLRGERSRTQFSALADVSSATLYRYEHDETPIPADVIVRICEKTGARADWMLLGTGPMLRGQETPSEPEPPARPQRQTIGGILYRDVPLAGTQSADREKEGGGYLTMPDVEDDEVFALNIVATSMSPRLNPGDIVFVSPKRRDDPRFSIVVAEVGKDELVVRHLRRQGNMVILEAENPAVRAIELPAADVRILGRVVRALVGLGG